VTTVPSHADTDAAGRAVPADQAFLVDADAFDPSATVADRAAIAAWIPHRHEMALLDRVVWVADDKSAAVAAWAVKDDEFWVRGHFPEMPMLPGVLMVEAGAQLACYLYNILLGRPQPAAFLRIEDAVFRHSVAPGQTLFVFCREVKRSARRFISDIQGVVDGRVVFSARIHGINIQLKRKP
jgi:3-hydroxyacyl-[acyl-carrier-protein] dehydratase